MKTQSISMTRFFEKSDLIELNDRVVKQTESGQHAPSDDTIIICFTTIATTYTSPTFVPPPEDM